MKTIYSVLLLFLLSAAFMTIGAAADYVTAPSDLNTWLARLVAENPNLAIVIGVVGALRLLVKPVVAAAHAIADLTKTPKDDEFLRRLEASPALRFCLFVLDWFASVKVRR